MAAGLTRTRRPRSGHRKIAMVAMGLVVIGAGLFVFRYASEIAIQIGAFISPPPEGQNNTVIALSQGGYLPLVVWGFGFTLIGIGATMIRSTFMSSRMGSMGGASPGGVGGMSPDAMNAYMQQTLSAAQSTNAPRSGLESAAEREIVKIKCRTCGSLEAEDAAYCRKCGNPV